MGKDRAVNAQKCAKNAQGFLAKILIVSKLIFPPRKLELHKKRVPAGTLQ